MSEQKERSLAWQWEQLLLLLDIEWEGAWLRRTRNMRWLRTARYGWLEVWLRDHELKLLADQLEIAKREGWEAK